MDDASELPGNGDERVKNFGKDTTKRLPFVRTRQRKVLEESLYCKWEGDSVPMTMVVHGATIESCSKRVITLSLEGTTGVLPGVADASASMTDDHAVIALSLGKGVLLA